ncbi:hypothetical protein NL676_033863 [Syzygium grande]|nr:hypothetical protein NL676_033863 [Syzygium grande]
MITPLALSVLSPSSSSLQAFLAFHICQRTRASISKPDCTDRWSQRVKICSIVSGSLRHIGQSGSDPPNGDGKLAIHPRADAPDREVADVAMPGDSGRRVFVDSLSKKIEEDNLLLPRKLRERVLRTGVNAFSWISCTNLSF